MIKPPLGLRPRYIVEKERAIEIVEVISRYLAYEKLFPVEWLDELRGIESVIDFGERKDNENPRKYL